jgi:hypothetical protein
MKFKALKTFVSAFGSFDEGEVKDIFLDSYTFQNWVDTGYIEIIKEPKKKAVAENENK